MKHLNLNFKNSTLMSRLSVFTKIRLGESESWPSGRELNISSVRDNNTCHSTNDLSATPLHYFLFLFLFISISYSHSH